ncbi:hypothetical protein Thal_1037 [Thermocrinis albus DSM 14484]|uniref:Lipoprotein n=1 Tax=Thermocrinis albus (strain DSM 14484 / JCM 11386 / HI 11/12) TaxID=638303 RepID=D3SLN9_THEAH|nr:hypothetical protein [Thermocrinis albus]ADC89669.1 hypothetical protein Thal_1037 [Thermocrinis albus DSM 14484]
MRSVILSILVFGISSCGVVRTGEEGLYRRTLRTVIIENVESCKSLVSPGALVPQVCGRCKISFEPERKRLIIAETDECVRYDAYGCITTGGEPFVVNTVSCRPLAERPVPQRSQPQSVPIR